MNKMKYSEIIEKLEIGFYNHINQIGKDPQAIIMHPDTLIVLADNFTSTFCNYGHPALYYRGTLIYRSEDCNPNFILVC
jgi:hypothetical protein